MIREGGYYAMRPGLGAGAHYIHRPGMSRRCSAKSSGLWAGGGVGSPRPAVAPAADRTWPGRRNPDVRCAAGGADRAWVPEPSEVVLVETSAPLRARQAQALADHAPRWLDRIEDIDAEIPAILLANEFLDCLPDPPGGALRRRLARAQGRDRSGRRPDFRRRPADRGPRCALGRGARMVAATDASRRRPWRPDGLRTGGAALLIDYGRAEPGFGDTLQAVRGHRRRSTRWRTPASPT